ncbi:DNA-dependent metalloprotease dvc-1-like [Paramacrobiotus metropolitanus]|uniref:DNA-dependent metalloprotease dvc-1-like n=1 Tax=Paramacrobiotus metropolitanus TaxID=2943436 RepID=UPI002445A5E0|nr:DNA-dependent metalloprotease dvc-1-like [Paramacrobiotus metropolitanus]XP_055327903.1 DNA-dependent metalloprotease dvc-1-like [Paramacrobiotus metropolitanus]
MAQWKDHGMAKTAMPVQYGFEDVSEEDSAAITVILIEDCDEYQDAVQIQQDAELARVLSEMPVLYDELPSSASEKRDMVKRKVHPDYNSGLSPVDPEWEMLDPTPDIHALFIQFDRAYFANTLGNVEVKWSKQMMSCAGICRYQYRAGYCSIGLSLPLLKLRPRKDLVETLLHEMIHAYLFVTNNNSDRNDHGDNFHEHMDRINKQTGANITVYHSFHDEVEHYRQHIWRCNGPCQSEKPYFGFVRRSRNRAPCAADNWWPAHAAKCNGVFIKISEPEGFKSRKRKNPDLEVVQQDAVLPGPSGVLAPRPSGTSGSDKGAPLHQVQRWTTRTPGLLMGSGNENKSTTLLFNLRTTGGSSGINSTNGIDALGGTNRLPDQLPVVKKSSKHQSSLDNYFGITGKSAVKGPLKPSASNSVDIIVID